MVLILLACVGFAGTGGTLGATASSPPSEGTPSLSVLRVHLPKASRYTTTSLDFNLHFSGTDVNRSFHVVFAACHLDKEVAHSTFLRQVNGSIPRMLPTSFLEAHARRCQNR